MLAENCNFRSLEIPACNTKKDLRGCDSIICCSICPRVEYCAHACGNVVYQQTNTIEQIIEHLKIIEIELFSFCNRRCSWCPNGKLIDRHSFNSYLDIEILRQFLETLRKYEYLGIFSFSRYNEPFSDFDIFQERLALVREYFPYAKLVSNTNGDYLTKEKVHNTLINELSIMDYDCKGAEWCYQRLVEWEVENIIQYENYWVGNIGEKIILYYWNWPKSGVISDRGGNLKNYSLEQRTDPCFEPFRFLGINYDGSISPCCNIRNDSDSQKDFIYGNLKEKTLEEILTSEKVNAFKYKIIHGQYDANMPCYYCNNSGGRYSKSIGSILYE